jgi:hypothetical protein
MGGGLEERHTNARKCKGETQGEEDRHIGRRIDDERHGVRRKRRMVGGGTQSERDRERV